jgi:hypothetical protein
VTTKRKPKAEKPIVQETGGAPSPFDPPFAVKRVVIELLEEWLPRHATHPANPETTAYLVALKGITHAG